MATETVLITGASAGIGVELARIFAADGAALVLVARRIDRWKVCTGLNGDGHGSTVHVIAGTLAIRVAPGCCTTSFRSTV